jgi:hypothetical protein
VSAVVFSGFGMDQKLKIGLDYLVLELGKELRFVRQQKDNWV